MADKSPVPIATALLLATVTVCTIVLTVKVSAVLGDVHAGMQGAPQVIVGVNQALQKVNAPGTGTLAELDKTALALKSTLVHIDIAADHEDRQLSRLDQQEQTIFDDIHSETMEVQKTTMALTGTAQAATATIQTANATILSEREHLDAILRHSDETLVSTDVAVQRFTSVISNPSIDQTLQNTAKITESTAEIAKQGAAIAADIHKEADALTAPKPWYQKLGAYGTTGVNIACLVTHSCPF